MPAPASTVHSHTALVSVICPRRCSVPTEMISARVTGRHASLVNVGRRTGRRRARGGTGRNRGRVAGHGRRSGASRRCRRRGRSRSRSRGGRSGRRIGCGGRSPGKRTVDDVAGIAEAADRPAVHRQVERARVPDADAHLTALPCLVVTRADKALEDNRAVRHDAHQDRKSTRLNSSHMSISYAVFCLKKKKKKKILTSFTKKKKKKKK